jgi:hypothetical protein
MFHPKLACVLGERECRAEEAGGLFFESGEGVFDVLANVGTGRRMGRDTEAGLWEVRVAMLEGGRVRKMVVYWWGATHRVSTRARAGAVAVKGKERQDRERKVKRSGCPAWKSRDVFLDERSEVVILMDGDKEYDECEEDDDETDVDEGDESEDDNDSSCNWP